MIKVKSKGTFSNTKKWLVQAKRSVNSIDLHKYGKMGVNALSKATPRKTGTTASSWYYEIQKENDKYTIAFKNKNNQNGFPIAIILQYGHATKSGGWVEGIDYINPAIRSVFEKMALDAWEEVRS